MNSTKKKIFILILLLTILAGSISLGQVAAKPLSGDQQKEADLGVKQPLAEGTETATPPVIVNRPLIALSGYDTGGASLYGGSEFELTIYVKNNGKEFANNIVITFDGGEIYPRETGGVISLYEIDPGETVPVHQKFLISNSLAWAGTGVIRTTINYTSPTGVPFTDVFTITFSITYPNYTAPTATPTPGAPVKPQLVVNSYQMDVDPLTPGSVFKLSMEIINLGLADAKTVSIVFGGGVAPGDGSGTPQAGGVSGSSGDLSTFAPLGSSNIVYLGDVLKDSKVSTDQDFIVNVNTEPGAYTLKISFVYEDEKGNRIVDDQVITLLVYTPPQLEVSFYRDPGVLMVGMENILPLQVINMGRKTAILGNMKVSAENAEVFNNISLVGSLEPGGYYALDTTLLPNAEGSLDIKVVISYTDDFNQLRSFEQIIPVEIQPGMLFEPTPEGGVGMPEKPTETPQDNSFWSKIWRIIKGLVGLDSGSPTPAINEGEEMTPPEPVPDNGMKGG